MMRSRFPLTSCSGGAAALSTPAFRRRERSWRANAGLEAAYGDDHGPRWRAPRILAIVFLNTPLSAIVARSRSAGRLASLAAVSISEWPILGRNTTGMHKRTDLRLPARRDVDSNGPAEIQTLKNWFDRIAEERRALEFKSTTGRSPALCSRNLALCTAKLDVPS